MGADLERVFGATAEPLRIGLDLVDAEGVVTPATVTGKTAKLSIAPGNGQTGTAAAKTGANLSEFNGLDVTASLADGPTALYHHSLTSGQSAQLVEGWWVGQMELVDGGGLVEVFPNAPEGEGRLSFFTIFVAPRLAP